MRQSKESSRAALEEFEIEVARSAVKGTAGAPEEENK
jgi:hypothetical protein